MTSFEAAVADAGRELVESSRRRLRIPDSFVSALTAVQVEPAKATEEQRREFWRQYNLYFTVIEPAWRISRRYMVYFFIGLAVLLILQLGFMAGASIRDNFNDAQAKTFELQKLMNNSLDNKEHAAELGRVSIKAAGYRSMLVWVHSWVGIKENSLGPNGDRSVGIVVGQLLVPPPASGDSGGAAPAKEANPLQHSAVAAGGVPSDRPRTEAFQHSSASAGDIAMLLASLEILLRWLASYILPVVYGFLGACAYVLRRLSRSDLTSDAQVDLRIRPSLRLCIGILAGLAISWVLPVVGESGGFLALLPPLALSFVAGYGSEILFAILDRIVEEVRRILKADGSEASGARGLILGAAGERPDQGSPAQASRGSATAAPAT